MTYINITKFALINQLEKNHSVIETCRLKNVVIFIQTILSFVLSRKIINIYDGIARKYGNISKYFNDFFCLVFHSILGPDKFINMPKPPSLYSPTLFRSYKMGLILL